MTRNLRSAWIQTWGQQILHAGSLARAEIAWLDTEHCRSRADDYCAMPSA